jgi:hypothetical protein
MAKRKKSFRKKGPVAVSVIAMAIVVLFLIRLYQVWEPLYGLNFLRNGLTGPLAIGLRLTTYGTLIVTSAIYLVLALAGIVVLIGFLRLRRWSWVLLMAWTGVSLVISLLDYFYSRPNYVVMASNVIIAFALNITDVQRIFKIRSDDEPKL